MGSRPARLGTSSNPCRRNVRPPEDGGRTFCVSSRVARALRRGTESGTGSELHPPLLSLGSVGRVSVEMKSEHRCPSCTDSTSGCPYSVGLHTGASLLDGIRTGRCARRPGLFSSYSRPLFSSSARMREPGAQAGP